MSHLNLLSEMIQTKEIDELELTDDNTAILFISLKEGLGSIDAARANVRLQRATLGHEPDRQIGNVQVHRCLVQELSLQTWRTASSARQTTSGCSGIVPGFLHLEPISPPMFTTRFGL